MQKIVKGQRMGNSVTVPLTAFGIEIGKLYHVKKSESGEIIIREVKDEK